MTHSHTIDARAYVDIKKEGIKFGLINGMLALLLLFGSYYMGFNAFANMQFIDNFLPYMMIILIIAGFQIRKQNGGYLPFKEAIQFTFLSYVIAAFLTAVGTYVLFVLIDQSLTDRLFRAGIEKNRILMERMHASKEDIEKFLEDAAKNKSETNLKNIFLGLGIELIKDFVISMVIAIIIRKEKPALN